VAKGGLTPAGRALVRGLEARGMLLDLAHASAATIDDALAVARRPVVVSHTGVRATCDNARNLTDAQLRGVARTGGLIGIGFWPTAVCGAEPRDVARAIRHAVSVAGVDHVGLGSDFDGAVEVPFDAAGLALLTDALLAEGFSDEDVARVMGANAIRVLQSALPES
jgi:membrane dipeptidase